MSVRDRQVVCADRSESVRGERRSSRIGNLFAPIVGNQASMCGKWTISAQERRACGPLLRLQLRNTRSDRYRFFTQHDHAGRGALIAKKPHRQVGNMTISALSRSRAALAAAGPARAAASVALAGSAPAVAAAGLACAVASVAVAGSAPARAAAAVPPAPPLDPPSPSHPSLSPGPLPPAPSLGPPSLPNCSYPPSSTE